MEAYIFDIQKFSLHDGPGIRTTVFFLGCNLRCAWCANPESQPMRPVRMDDKPAGRLYSLEEVVQEVLKDKPFYEQSGGGVTLSGGEPLLQPAFVLALIDRLHEEAVTVGIETAADVPEEIFLSVLEKLDFVQIDIKHWNQARHRAGTGVGTDRILANIRAALQSGRRVILRIPVIPGYNDSLEDAAGFAALLGEMGAGEVQLMPFHQFGEDKYKKLGREYAYAGVPQLHDEDLEAYAGVLRAAGLRVQVGG